MMKLTATQALTVAHGLPERFSAHALAPDGTQVWSFAPAHDASDGPHGIDAIVTDLRSFEQRPWTLTGSLGVAPEEQVYLCFVRLIAPPESAPIIVLTMMARSARGVRAHIARIDTAQGELRALSSDPVDHAGDHPRVDALGDQSAICVRYKDGRTAVFTADGERSTDPMLLDALGPADDRCALTRSLRARIDGSRVLFEDLRTRERWHTEPLCPAPLASATLRAIDERRCLLSIARPRPWSALIDARTRSTLELPRAGRVERVDASGVVFVRQHRDPVVLLDLERDVQRSVPTGNSTFVGASRERVVLLRAGRFETISRATGALDERQTSATGPIARLMISDRGAVCAQDTDQHFLWWSELADALCDSDALSAELARAARIEQWIDGQQTLLVSRTRGNQSTLAGLRWSEPAPIERWSFDVARADAVACDSSGRCFAAYAHATRTLALYEWDGVAVRCVARSAAIARGSAIDPDHPRVTLHVHDDRAIELATDLELSLFEQRGDALERTAVRGTCSADPIAADIAPTVAEIPEIDLELGLLLPSAPALPHFAEQPLRRSLSARVATRNAQCGGPAKIEMERKGFVWIPRAPFSLTDHVTALAIAPNARWGAIGTHRGVVLRFAIEPREPRDTHSLRQPGLAAVSIEALLARIGAIVPQG